MGRPYAPATLVELIAAEYTPHRVRHLAFEELVIRYNLDFPFDTELSVRRQRKVLREIDDWVRSYGDRFQPGIWYFDGQSVE